MKHFFASLLGVLLTLGSVVAPAQVMPPAPPVSLQGQPLKNWLRQNWYDGRRTVLSYSAARGKMYNYIDNQNGSVVCVYSGYTENTPLDSTSTNPGVVSRINCEHSIPQSWFDQVERMRSDIHHLFPTYDTWNSDRGSDPFAEIPDAQTLKWVRGTQSQTTIPPAATLNEWSEDTNAQFEPREDHKGNLARAAFYFYTMHQNEVFDPGKNVITALADLNTLYQWHMADPVDARERERNRRTANSQGNFNPYTAYPDLVARAFGFQVLPTFAFTAATGSVAEGNTGTTAYTTTVTLTPAATAPLTIQVALDATYSTALTPSDFMFASPQTLTFAAGQTTQAVTVTVNGDAAAEANETVLLQLRNVGSGAAIGGPATHELTITNDDGTPPSVRFAAATGSVLEGNAGTTTYTVSVTAENIPAGGVSVPVTVDAANTTATAADYILNTSSLTFAANPGSQTGVVTVTVTGDATPEPNETVRLRLGTPTNPAVLLVAPVTHTLTVLNDDQAPAGSPCTDLYFSEYVEGAATNTKALEIFNPSPAPISLAGIRIELYANGSSTPTGMQALSGTLAPGEVYVVANTGVVSPVVAGQTDLQSNVGFFNGDDAIALLEGSDTLDVIGVVGVDPGTTWAIPGGGSTTDNTLVRRPTVARGEIRWSVGAATWQALGTDVYTNVGSHSSTACLVSSATKNAPLATGLAVYPNPAATTVQVQVSGLSGRHATDIRLYNALGQLVLTDAQTLTGTEAATLDVRNLPAGLYSVRVTVDGVRYTSRVAVRP